MQTQVHRQSHQGPFRVGIGAIVMIAAVTGCGELEPCAGAREGVRFEIEVLGPKDPDLTCGEFLDFGSGALLQGTIVELRGENDCKSGVPKFEHIGDWQLIVDNEVTTLGGSTLEARYTITRETCSASLWFFLHSRPPLDCDARRGDLCTMELRINPVPTSAAACPNPCFGKFNVRAERL